MSNDETIKTRIDFNFLESTLTVHFFDKATELWEYCFTVPHIDRHVDMNFHHFSITAVSNLVQNIFFWQWLMAILENTRGDYAGGSHHDPAQGPNGGRR